MPANDDIFLFPTNFEILQNLATFSGSFSRLRCTWIFLFKQLKQAPELNLDSRLPALSRVKLTTIVVIVALVIHQAYKSSRILTTSRIYTECDGGRKQTWSTFLTAHARVQGRISGIGYNWNTSPFALTEIAESLRLAYVVTNFALGPRWTWLRAKYDAKCAHDDY